eukprot:TRINITY_DN18531_c1_g1_i2.p1 TRINITY_DN18531_c1_g1~~TRINITY_DN18531_c1_g1_i2.p1  ORF type:complete len:762 (-),score=148.18 TRINITY_DN18531_c1_g1_i2:249-2534(-)
MQWRESLLGVGPRGLALALLLLYLRPASAVTGRSAAADADVSHRTVSLVRRAPEAASAAASASASIAVVDAAGAVETAGAGESGHVSASAPAAAADREQSWLGPKVLAGSGAFGALVEHLVSWLRGAATWEQVQSMEMVRRWLSSTDLANRATEQLERDLEVDEWQGCADEGGSCVCKTGFLRYGDAATERWAYKNVTTTRVLASGLADEQKSNADSVSFHCGSDFFGGDPAPGVVKRCSCMALWKALRCSDGGPIDWTRCPASSRGLLLQAAISEDNFLNGGALFGERLCIEGCQRSSGSGDPGDARDLLALDAMAKAAKADASATRAKPVSAGASKALCAGTQSRELLWNCGSLVPPTGSSASSMATVLFEATRRLCKSPFADQLEVSLDCDFAHNYRRWVKKSSDFFDEAYVTYIGGRSGSDYEWQATSLLRSIELFSTRPIIVVAFTEPYVPPATWRDNKNVIVYRMNPQPAGVSFNFNKIRAMIAARVATGIQLDTDQLIFSGMDNVFAATRREASEDYPYPIMPVHWMSRDAKKGEPYDVYAQTGYSGPKTMRWAQAHPTWTFWALPFLTNLLDKRLAAQDYDGESGPPAFLEAWMAEDEDMLNVHLWQAGATKQWCKFDLFPDMFVRGPTIESDVYADRKWYPKGVGLVFYSSHATKEFATTDWLISLMARCRDPAVNASARCSSTEVPPQCWGAWDAERRARLADPAAHAAELCCCLRPRDHLPFFARGKWFAHRAEAPEVKAPGSNGSCLFP